MLPDFSKNITDTLAKRAGFVCSNPDCRVSTVGPNAEPHKYTTIGEAAHICGARSGSARYDGNMSDAARGEITNAIWLCTNCHTQIDKDAGKFPASLLFVWREDHERYVGTELGNASDRIRVDALSTELDQFKTYPPIVRRIVADKPIGWEYRLTAELLRHLSRPALRRLRDLNDGLYTRPAEIIEDNAAFPWIHARLAEMETLVSPLEKLLSLLTKSWGSPGQEGNIYEIHHVCILISQALDQISIYEERLNFAIVPDKYKSILNLLQNCLGSQAHKFETIPLELENALALIGTNHGGTKENPLVIEKIIVFELPDGWENRMKKELAKLEIREIKGFSWSSWFWVILAVCLIFYLV